MHNRKYMGLGTAKHLTFSELQNLMPQSSILNPQASILKPQALNTSKPQIS